MPGANQVAATSKAATIRDASKLIAFPLLSVRCLIPSYAISPLFARPRLAASARFSRVSTFRCARRGRQIAALFQPRDPIFPGARHRARLQLVGAGELGLAAGQRADPPEHHRAQLDLGVGVRVDGAEYELTH